MKLKLTAALLLLIGVGKLTADRITSDVVRQPVTTQHEALVDELEILPDYMPVDITAEEFPEVYQFFATKISARDEGSLGLLTILDSCSGESVRTISLAGGLLGTLDRGNGIVQLVGYTMDLEGSATGLALSAVLTADGLEVLEIDYDRLAVLLGDGEKPDFDAQSDVGFGFTPKPKNGPTTTADMECQWTENSVCCAFPTDAKFCVCCASLKPVRVGCMCVPLV